MYAHVYVQLERAGYIMSKQQLTIVITLDKTLHKLYHDALSVCTDGHVNGQRLNEKQIQIIDALYLGRICVSGRQYNEKFTFQCNKTELLQSLDDCYSNHRLKFQDALDGMSNKAKRAKPSRRGASEDENECLKAHVLPEESRREDDKSNDISLMTMSQTILPQQIRNALSSTKLHRIIVNVEEQQKTAENNSSLCARRG